MSISIVNYGKIKDKQYINTKKKLNIEKYN